MSEEIKNSFFSFSLFLFSLFSFNFYLSSIPFGPFFIALHMMLISTVSKVVKRMRKRKKVVITAPEPNWLTPTHVGSMS